MLRNVAFRALRIQEIARLGAAGAALMTAAGCVSEAPAPQRMVSYNTPYVGADTLNENNRPDGPAPMIDGGIAGAASLAAADEPVSDAIPVAFQGVEGARLAHHLYGDVEAERFDGACEPVVKILQGETLYDISQYCDVPVDTLVAYNPQVKNPRFVVDGEEIKIPQAEGYGSIGKAAPGGVAYGWYVVQPGDTLQKISASHLSTPAELAALNPDVDWKLVPVGVALRVPAAGGVAAAAPVAGAIAKSGASAPQPAEPAAEGGYSVSPSVKAVMPYNLKPTPDPSPSAENAPASLSVDRRVVKPGGAVMVSGTKLPPNAEVSIYSGSNGREMNYVTTVHTDAEGTFSQSVPAKGASDLGGVIFKATVSDTGEELQSPRVGVDKIKPEK